MKKLKLINKDLSIKVTSWGFFIENDLLGAKDPNFLFAVQILTKYIYFLIKEKKKLILMIIVKKKIEKDSNKKIHMKFTKEKNSINFQLLKDEQITLKFLIQNMI